MRKILVYKKKNQIRQQPNLAIFSDRFGESLAQTHVVSIEAAFLFFFLSNKQIITAGGTYQAIDDLINSLRVIYLRGPLLFRINLGI